MDTLFLWSHPLTQILALFAGLIAFSYGFINILKKHFNKHVIFPWKKHVYWGTIALTLWIIGPLTGLTITWIKYERFFTTEYHGYGGLTILILTIISLLTGIIMNKNKKQRTVLPIIHGIINITLIILVLCQIVTGYTLLETLS